MTAYLGRVHRPAHGLDLVEVEGIGPGHGAVEPRLEEGGPFIFESVRSAVIVFTHPGHSAVDGLKVYNRLNISVKFLSVYLQCPTL